MLPDFFTALLPLFIFLARLADVTLGTFRIICVSRGLRNIAPFIGFVEIMIWLVAISQIMQNLNNPINYVAYAGGFAMGNFLGLYLEGRVALGYRALHIITTKDAKKLLERIRDSTFAVNSVSARGVSGRVRIIIAIVKRKKLKGIIGMVEKFDPDAFISIEDVHSVKEKFSEGIPAVSENFLKNFARTRRGR